MKIVPTIAQAQKSHAKKGPRVLVPTMGALHKAHSELIRVARETAGKDVGGVQFCKVVKFGANPLSG